MIHGHLSNPETFQPFLQATPWNEALTWLKNNSHLPDGEYEIINRDVYALISTITTKPASECAFEAHKEYIDIHFCIEGGEVIAWAPVNTLSPTMNFNTEKDYCLYQSPTHTTNLQMPPGSLAIFYPADAHMPKISDGQNSTVKKIVIKIKRALV